MSERVKGGLPLYRNVSGTFGAFNLIRFLLEKKRSEMWTHPWFFGFIILRRNVTCRNNHIIYMLHDQMNMYINKLI